MRISDVQTEREFQDGVLKLARTYRWLYWHDNHSRRNRPGLPDLILAHPRWGRLVVAELKTRRGRVRPEQAAWLAALQLVAQASRGAVYAAVWRPDDWPEITAVLSGRAHP